MKYRLAEDSKVNGSRRPRLGLWGAILLLGLPGFFRAVAGAGAAETGVPRVNSIAELRQAIGPGTGRVCAYSLEGTVLAANRAGSTVLFQDASGTAALNVHWDGVRLQAGQHIRLAATNVVSRTDTGLSLGASPLVDVDGRHPALEKPGTIFLNAGRHPLRIDWFNWASSAHLGLAYSGPGLEKQPVPPTAFWQDAREEHRGLRFQCFEGDWDRMPNFDRLAPVKAGTVSHLDVSVRSRPEDVGLTFRGFVEVPREGKYTFYLNSDDGGQLYLDNLPEIALLGQGELPAATPVIPGQPLLSTNQDSLWAEAEGTLEFLRNARRGVEFELVSGGSRMRVLVASAAPAVPAHLLHSLVRVRGVCPGVWDAEGHKYAGLMVAGGWSGVQVLNVAPESWAQFEPATLDGLRATAATNASGGVARLCGKTVQDPVTQKLQFEDGTGMAPMERLGALPLAGGKMEDCLCEWFWNGSHIQLAEAVCRRVPQPGDVSSNAVPVLTTALQVQQLRPEEAGQRQYPVEIEGVVTYVSSDLGSLVIQDSTRAVYVAVDPKAAAELPREGEVCQIRGVALPGEFSPIVAFQSATILGRGRLPPPVSPTRDQMLNGSLDAQYVELRGMVTSVNDGSVTLLTSEGAFDVNVAPGPAEPWEQLLNSIVRVRGCFFADWNKETHRIILDRPVFRIWAATVSVEVPAPADLFAADVVHARELMHFDPRFNTFRRVKVRGQIVHAGAHEFFLMDETTGLRFHPVAPEHFDPGDEVEVVGLVELGGASALLRQAVARRIGHGPVPEARELSLQSPGDQVDATRVWVAGTLVDVRDRGGLPVLEIQVGVKRFAARLPAGEHPPRTWEIGSSVKLTGVYHSLDGNQTAEAGVSSFELLLNTPGDVQVISRPPWWTLGRLLALGAVLGVGLLFATVWIMALRRTVERRTVQLRQEIEAKERVEKIRAVEQERSRIARDLHDDLGSELTEITMMASAKPGANMEPETAATRLRAIADKTRTMISALDGVVWVTNSKNDTLTSMLEYLASYAEEFLAKAGVACRMELPPARLECRVAAEMRHDVLLAFREALNNAVRHGRPGEVLVRFVLAAGTLEILIRDNGCGFAPGPAVAGNLPGNGLVNLQERLRKLGGQCRIESAPGQGTSVILQLPLPG